MKIFVAILALACVAAVSTVSAANAHGGSGRGEGHTPVTLCHWVPAHGGSYIEITVDDDGADGNKKLEAHEGHEKDIIPAPAGGCSGKTPKPSHTPCPSRTPTSTSTPLPPTETPVPPTATHTSVPATATKTATPSSRAPHVRTATPTSTPTNQPPATTPTATVTRTITLIPPVIKLPETGTGGYLPQP